MWLVMAYQGTFVRAKSTFSGFQRFSKNSSFYLFNLMTALCTTASSLILSEVSESFAAFIFGRGKKVEIFKLNTEGLFS